MVLAIANTSADSPLNYSSSLFVCRDWLVYLLPWASTLDSSNFIPIRASNVVILYYVGFSTVMYLVLHQKGWTDQFYKMDAKSRCIEGLCGAPGCRVPHFYSIQYDSDVKPAQFHPVMFSF